MKKIDWKKFAPQVMLGGIGIIALGGIIWGQIKGECPFSLCAKAITGNDAASATTVNAAEKRESVEWLTDFDAAKKLAEKENKILFLSFSGSDWCPWCIRLAEEVFDKPEFQAWAKENAILVDLDFPRQTKQPAAVKQQNDMLASTYKVEGFPTVILTDFNGKEINRTGYQRGGSTAYVKHLNNLKGTTK